MKKNRLTMTMLIMLMIAAFSFSSTYAQEVKKEMKVVKIKVSADDDGKVSVDTSFVLDEEFDGDWKALVADEEMLEKLEEMDIQIDIAGDESKIMVWHGEGDHKHKAHNEMFYSDEMDMDVEIEVVDGDTIMKYTITMDGEEHENSGDVMFWSTDEEGGSHGKVMTKTIIIETDDDGNIIKEEISSDGENYFFHGDKDIELIEIDGHHGTMLYISSIKVSEPDGGEMSMLEDANVKMGKEALHLHDLSINKAHDNIKLSFYANELKNLSIAVYNAWGKQIYLEELKTFDGKYIREMELSGDEDDEYYLHIRSGKKSLTKKINLD